MKTNMNYMADSQNYLWELEKEWRCSRQKYSDKELLDIFPEAKKIIPEKIVEWEEYRSEFFDTIKKKLTIVKQKVSDNFSQWFWREWIKVTDGEELLKAEKQIARLKSLLLIAKGKTVKGKITEEQIQHSLSVPITNLIQQPLRKSGKVLIGLCPFHTEKNPSFYVYPETNSCWCFGCSQGGNTIKLARLLHGYSFKEAISYLTQN